MRMFSKWPVKRRTQAGLVMMVRCCAWSCSVSSCPVITPSGEYLPSLSSQWSLRGHGALFTLTPVIMRLKCDCRSSGDVTAVVWSLSSKTRLCVY